MVRELVINVDCLNRKNYFGLYSVAEVVFDGRNIYLVDDRCESEKKGQKVIIFPYGLYTGA